MVNWLELTRLLSFRIRNGISETLKNDGSSCIAISFFFFFYNSSTKFSKDLKRNL